MVCLKNIEDL